MGIYIPNMSKPKICYMCPLSDETWFCPIVGEAIPRANRKLENCPLIEIGDIEYQAYKEFRTMLLKKIEERILYGERKNDDHI